MADQAAPPNLGNETDVQFIARPEFKPDYQNPDGADFFSTLNQCVNAVWPRAVRDNLRYLNKVLRCEQSTPLSDLICGVQLGSSWRPSDDAAYAIQAGDFAAANVLAPDHFWNLNGDYVPQLGALDIRQDEQADRRIYTYKTVRGRNGAAGTKVIGLRTFYQWGGFSDPYNAALVDSLSIAGSITVRIPEWPQANDGITLLAVKHKRSQDEIGAQNRLGWEFGLGRSGISPPDIPSEYCLFLRWRTIADSEVHTAAAIIDSSTFEQPIGITPGDEYTLGFHRRNAGGGFYAVDFYVNGIKVYTSDSFVVPAFGNSTDIRLLVGAGSDGVQFAGGPIRNVALWQNTDDAATVGPAQLFTYQRGAGWI